MQVLSSGHSRIVVFGGLLSKFFALIGVNN